MHLLSKSSYIRGRQCPKALWLYKHQRELMSPVDTAKQAVFDTGILVGLLAQQLFPKGVDCKPESPLDFGPSISATREAIANGANVIYEAAFLHEDVLAALDILVRDDNGWKAYEVKSSSTVKEYQVHDAALQAHVIEGSGIQLADISIVHMNNSYVRRGGLDIQKLFTITSVKQGVELERASVPVRIAELKNVLPLTEAPAIDIGPQCNSPFACDFTHHCWAHLPTDGTVLELANARGRDWELYRRGIVLMKDVPSNEPLSAAQRVQVDGWRHGRGVVDQQALKGWIADLRYPLYHFDFETFMPAVPLFDGSRPFQQIPFQYSVHVQQGAGAEPAHLEFLGDGTGDPREALVRQLLQDLGTEGHILTYHASFERRRLQELATDLPHHAAALNALLSRVIDLETPFKRGWYYVPAMNGRTSIKVVLPTLVPTLNYKDLGVQEGGTASLLYGQLCSGQFAGDVSQLRTDLLAYCRMDTLAMVRILEVLRSVSA